LIRLIWQHPANRRRRLSAVAKAALWQTYKHTIRRPFDLSVYGGLRVRAYPDSHEAGRVIYYGGVPDYDEMTLMRRYLRPSDRFIDGGANIGLYTLLAASLVGGTGRVDAFEPAPLEARRLRENVARNGLVQVQIHEAALADSPGQAEFTTDRPASGNRLRRDEDEQAKSTAVPVVTIDSILPSGYAMAKLDLEGAEPLALRGAERHLDAGDPPIMLIELVDRFVRRFGSSAFDVAEWLEQRGYVLATYDAMENRLELHDHTLAGSRTNVFAVFERRLPFIRDRLERPAARIELQRPIS
jgi:FkbM family methyltransferase